MAQFQNQNGQKSRRTLAENLVDSLMGGNLDDFLQTLAGASSARPGTPASRPSAAGNPASQEPEDWEDSRSLELQESLFSTPARPSASPAATLEMAADSEMASISETTASKAAAPAAAPGNIKISKADQNYVRKQDTPESLLKQEELSRLLQPSPSNLVQGILWSEILGAPRCRRSPPFHRLR